MQFCVFVVSGSCSALVAWSSCAWQQLQCGCGGTGRAGDLGSCLSQLSQKTSGIKPPLKPFSSASLEAPFCKSCPLGHLPLGSGNEDRDEEEAECELVGPTVLGGDVEVLSQYWERA